MAVLAIIGLVVILYFIGKFLKNVGDILIGFGNAMGDITSALSRNPSKDTQYTRTKREKVSHKIRDLKGVDDDDYTNQVRKEIEKLTGEED